MSAHENAGGGNRCPNGHYLPAPGPSAEDALRWACANERRFQFGCYETEWEYVARGLAALTRAPGGQDAPDAARKEGV